MRQRILPLVLFSSILTLSAHSQVKITNAYRINLQSAEGLYLSATRGTPPSLQAIVDKPNLDEFYVLEDLNGGALESGDHVRIYAHSGYVAASESNDEVLASPKPDEILQMQIVKTQGDGPIRNHDQIRLQTDDGSYIVETGAGKMKVSNNSGGSTLTISVAEVNAAISERFAQDWKAGWGISFDDSPQGINGRKLQYPSSLSSLSGFGTNHAVSNSNSKNNTTSVAGNGGTMTTKNHPQNTNKPQQVQQVKQPVANTVKGLPAALPPGYYKCYVDHVSNLAMAGYFTVLAGNKYVFHGFDANKRTGPEGSFTYDAKTGKIIWLSGSWKTNNYYGLYSLDATYGDRIYLIPNGSDYSACKCFLQK